MFLFSVFDASVLGFFKCKTPECSPIHRLPLWKSCFLKEEEKRLEGEKDVIDPIRAGLYVLIPSPGLIPLIHHSWNLPSLTIGLRFRPSRGGGGQEHALSSSSKYYDRKKRGSGFINKLVFFFTSSRVNYVLTFRSNTPHVRTPLSD